jgi:hypothetical protein
VYPRLVSAVFLNAQHSVEIGLCDVTIIGTVKSRVRDITAALTAAPIKMFTG